MIHDKWGRLPYQVLVKVSELLGGNSFLYGPLLDTSSDGKDEEHCSQLKQRHILSGIASSTRRASQDDIVERIFEENAESLKFPARSFWPGSTCSFCRCKDELPKRHSTQDSSCLHSSSQSPVVEGNSSSSPPDHLCQLHSSSWQALHAWDWNTSSAFQCPSLHLTDVQSFARFPCTDSHMELHWDRAGRAADCDTEAADCGTGIACCTLAASLLRQATYLSGLLAFPSCLAHVVEYCHRFFPRRPHHYRYWLPRNLQTRPCPTTYAISSSSS
jgi:hypothetical protein